MCHRSVTIYMCGSGGEQNAYPNSCRFGGPSSGIAEPISGWIKLPWLRRPERAGSGLSKWSKGKPGAEFGLILRTLKSLEISISVAADSPVEAPPQSKVKAPDINSVLDSLKKRPLKKQI